MTTRFVTLPLFLLLPGFAVAQEMPKPAAELQKYAPLIGSWQGTGTAQMGPGEPTKWESHSTYSWALGDFFVQEDTIVRFADMPKPLAMRCYYGWDAENARYVAVSADNDGTVDLQRIEFTADGSMVQLAESHHDGETSIERYTTKVVGDSMTFAIDVIGLTGPSSQPVTGTMQRVDKPAPGALDASAFTATPAAPIQQLAKTAGTYAVQASLVMMPGMPVMKITGQDEVVPRFDGNIVHVHTTGTAEGSPEQYVAELFYGFDRRRNCIRAVHVSNMGEVGEMTGQFTPDGKSFVLTSAFRYMGQPCVQRTTMELDADGAVVKSIGHAIVGTAEPYESWNATYTKK